MRRKDFELLPQREQRVYERVFGLIRRGRREFAAGFAFLVNAELGWTGRGQTGLLPDLDLDLVVKTGWRSICCHNSGYCKSPSHDDFVR